MYTTGTNIPGYLPDNEAQEHDTWQEAKESILAELKRDFDTARDGCTTDGALSGYVLEYNEAVKTFNDTTDQNDVYAYFNGLSYWIQAA